MAPVNGAGMRPVPPVMTCFNIIIVVVIVVVVVVIIIVVVIIVVVIIVVIIFIIILIIIIMKSGSFSEDLTSSCDKVFLRRNRNCTEFIQHFFLFSEFDQLPHMEPKKFCAQFYMVFAVLQNVCIGMK